MTLVVGEGGGVRGGMPATAQQGGGGEVVGCVAGRGYGSGGGGGGSAGGAGGMGTPAQRRRSRQDMPE